MKRTSTQNETIPAVAIIYSVIVVLILTLPSMTQTDNARILGDVRDVAGQPLRGATVTISNSQRGATRILVTPPSGEYAAPNLAPGFIRSLPRQSVSA